MHAIQNLYRQCARSAAALRADSCIEHLLAYLAAVAQLSELLVVVSLSALSVILSLAVEYGLGLLQVHDGLTGELWNHGIGFIFVMVVILAPPIETLMLQLVPILLARRVGLPTVLQFAMGSVPFAALHFTSGVVSGLAAGVVGGVILSLAYLTFVNQSRVLAFVVTMAVHSFHNMVFWIVYAYGAP